MYRPHHRATRSRRDAYTLFLVLQLLQQIKELEYRPPVTLLLIAVNALIHFDDFLPYEVVRWIPKIRDGCLQPYYILAWQQWPRLFWSAFLHADDVHLLYNMSSLLWKGVLLERQYGSLGFLALVGELLILSHSLVVGGAYVMSCIFPEYGYLYKTTCAVGFSAVLFALKVVLNHNSETFSQVPYLGFSLPTKYLCWVELVLASLLNPQASFFGHLCGIVAGLLYVWYLRPLGTWAYSVVAEQQPGTHRRWDARRQYFTGSGTTGGGPQGPSEGAPGRPPSRPLSEEELRQRRLLHLSNNSSNRYR